MSSATASTGRPSSSGWSLRLAHLVLPVLGGTVSMIALVDAVWFWDPVQVGEFQGHWWSIAAAVPGNVSSLASIGVVTLVAGGVVLLADRRRGARDRRPRRRPLLRGLTSIAAVALLWGGAAARAETSTASFLAHPTQHAALASAQVRRVVGQDALTRGRVRRVVISDGVAALGPLVLVTATSTSTSSTGEGVSTDYTMLVNPLTGRLEDAWFHGM